MLLFVINFSTKVEEVKNDLLHICLLTFRTPYPTDFNTFKSRRKKRLQIALLYTSATSRFLIRVFVWLLIFTIGKALVHLSAA